MRLSLLCVLIFVACIVVCEPTLDKVKAEDGWGISSWIQRTYSYIVDKAAEALRKQPLKITVSSDTVNKNTFVNTAEDIWTKTSWKNIPFNDIVVKADRYKRPFVRNKRGTDNYKQHHEAVAVTIQDRERWLIEKGDGYASKAYYNVNSYPFKTSDTIVIPWDSRIPSTWTVEESERVTCNRTIWDFMKAALLKHKYNMLGSNCQHAAKRMMTLAKEKRCNIRQVGPHYPMIMINEKKSLKKAMITLSEYIVTVLFFDSSTMEHMNPDNYETISRTVPMKVLNTALYQ